MLTNGQRIITGYFVIAYVVPIIAHTIIGNGIVSDFAVHTVSPFALVQLLGVYALFSWLHVQRFRRLEFVTFGVFAEWLLRNYLKFRVVIALTSIATGLLVVYNGLSSYIYQEEISGRDFSTVVLLGLSSFCRHICIVDLICRILGSGTDWLGDSRRRRLESVLMAIGLITLANAVTSLWIAMMGLTFSLAPNRVERVVFSQGLRSRLKSFVPTVMAVVPFVALFLVAWYFGTILKMTSGRELGDLFSTDASDILFRVTPSAGFESDESAAVGALYWLVDRLSIFYYSWTFTADISWETLNYSGAVILIPIKSALFRIAYLLNAIGFSAFGSPIRPDIATVGQLNYQLLTTAPINPRSGSSPGLLGSFNYVAPFPLNIILCAVYLWWICRRLDLLASVGRPRRLTLLGIMVLFPMLAPLFTSPPDLLVFIDDGFIFVSLLILGGAFAKQRRSAALAGRLPDREPWRLRRPLASPETLRNIS